MSTRHARSRKLRARFAIVSLPSYPENRIEPLENRLLLSNVNPSGTSITPPSFVSGYQPEFIQNFAAMTSLSQAQISGTRTMGSNAWIPDQPNTSFDFGPWAIPSGSGASAAPYNMGSGYLTVTAQNNNAATWYGNDAANFGGFTSGLISTVDGSNGGFSQQYGYFVCSMKTPGGANTFPSFWLDTNNSAVNAAEIDVTESYGSDSTAGNTNYTTWHLWGVNGQGNQGVGSNIAEPGMTSGFHTYGVDIEPTGVTWYYDNVAVWSQTAAQLGSVEMAALAQPMYAMVDLGLSGGTNESNTPNPSVLDVQYVAIYASPSSPNYTLGSTQPKNVSATAASASQVNLSWTAPTGSVSGYNVYRATTPDGQGSTALNSSLITGTSYSDTTASAGTAYYYTVKGVASGGAQSAASNQASATTPSSLPNAISVQFVGGGTALTSAQQAGVWPVAQTNWNALTGNSWSSHSLLYSSGSTSGATLSGQSSGTYGGGQIADGVPNDNTLTSGELFNYGTLASAITNNDILTFSNIPYSSYSVYVTASIDSPGRGETIQFTPAGGSAQYGSFTTENTAGDVQGYTTPWLAAASTWNGSGTAPALPLANYSRFTGLTANSFQLTWGSNISNGGINSIEIVPVTVLPPSAPTGLTASTASSSQINLSWNSVTGATSYNVYRGTTPGGESGTAIATGIGSTSYSNTGLTANTTYYYTVKAVNSAGTSGASNEASATTQVTVPSAPTGLTATAASSSQINLSWNSVTGATSYNVYRGTTPGGESGTAIATGIGSTSYSNTGLSASTTYYYTVKAVNSAGTSGASNEASATTQSSGSTSSVGVQFIGNNGTALTSTTSAGVSAQTNWNAFTGSSWSGQSLLNNSGASSGISLSGAAAGPYFGSRMNDGITGDGNLTSGELYNPGTLANAIANNDIFTFSNITYTSYNVYITASIDAAGRNQTIQLTPGGGSAQYLSFITNDNGTSTWVAATNTWNGSGTPPSLPAANYAEFTGLSAGSFTLTFGSAASNGAINSVQIVGLSGPTIPAAPTGLTATAASSSQINLNWNSAAGATSYNVYRGTTPGGESATAIATGISSTSYSNTGLTASTTYYYTVKAVNSAGTSGASNEASATTQTSGPNPSVGVQFVGSNGTALASANSAGVVQQTNWNALTGSSWSNQSLVNNSGAGSGITLSGSTGGAYFGSSMNDGVSGDTKLTSGEVFNPGTLANAIASNDVLTFSNITYASYYVIVTASVDAAGRNMTIKLTPNGGTAQYLSYITNDNGTSTWVAATNTWNGTGTTPSLPAANYAEFTGLGASGFILTFGSANSNGAINSVEIVDPPLGGSKSGGKSGGKHAMSSSPFLQSANPVTAPLSGGDSLGIDARNLFSDQTLLASDIEQLIRPRAPKTGGI